MKNIEEIIADARAEEEVAREQKKAEIDQGEESFRETLREGLKDYFNKSNKEITINLADYIVLMCKAKDLERILAAILDGLELSYNNEYLTLRDGDKVTDAIRVLYPEAYDAIYAAELDKVNEEKEA